MDPDATRPIATDTVIYRCSCGNEFPVDTSTGGVCNSCNKPVSPKMLGHELAQTMTIHEGSFELDQTMDHRDGSAASTKLDGERQGSANQTDPSQLLGSTYGHFELVSTLGRGGMGQVYRAMDTSLQRYVAVKLLRSGIGTGRGEAKSSEQEVDKLLQEAVSQARVSHPNIVTIYYVGKQDGDPFLAMELVNGQTLGDRIESADLAFSEISEIAIQICQALKYSYELDIVHGDIKPSNVLLQNTGIAKLSDFGMARRISVGEEKATGGTPNYIAPELLRGERPSIQSDMYAVGVTLYEMTFGCLPVDLTGRTAPEWLGILDSSVLEFPTPWPDHLPEQWKVLLSVLLDKDPQQRFKNYAELMSELERVRPGPQVLARVFPRIIAATFDWLSVMVVAIVLKVALQTTALGQMVAGHPIITFLIDVCDFLPIIVYMIVVYFWRQSVGRSLMHIRVVNRYGLPPSGYRMTLRSLIRMQFPWFFICFSLFNDPTNSWMGLVMGGVLAISCALLLIDVAVMCIYDRGRSLHDWLLETRVVLDTQDR